MRVLHLFAGAGGGLLADLILGHRIVGAVEIDDFCQRVLAQRQKDGLLPEFPIFGDIRAFNAEFSEQYRGVADCVAGGFPCQCFSGAARGRYAAENLWPEMLRVIKSVSPVFVFCENVARRAIDTAAEDLEALGYSTRCVALSARDMGADHLRRRYWLAAYAYGDSELLLSEYAKVEQLPRVRPSVWNSNPKDSRVDDGMARRMDRLTATGNGQVPCVASAAWSILLGALI